MKLEEIFTFENLYGAYKECRRGRQHKGEVIRFEIDLAVNINKLIKEIINRKYKLDRYKVFEIYEPKKRTIEALPFKDRVVIKCFCNVVLKKKIEKKLIYDNAACRKNKGTSFAVMRLTKFLKREYIMQKNNNFYFLKCDIKKYFPSINHEILLSLLENINFSSDEMWFIRKLVKEQPNNAQKGLPLGNQSSQWFALFYLNEVDRLIKEKLQIKFYIRYMDDLILIHNDKLVLKKCLGEIQKKCKELDLELNKKTQIGIVKNGIEFLGYRHILKEDGTIIRSLRSSSKIRMKRHIKVLKQLQYRKQVDKKYIEIRKKAFNNHLKGTKDKRNYVRWCKDL